MMSNTERNAVIEQVAEHLKKHFTPAFEIVKKDQEKVAAEFNRIAFAMRETDKEIRYLEDRIAKLENLVGVHPC